jgi:hypothetical protein
MRLLIRSSRILSLVILAACAGRSPQSSPSADSETLLQVQNQSFSDMVIYALSSTQRIRLGTATGNSTKSFVLPQYLVRSGGTLRFQADPIGGNRAPVSEEMSVQPGDVVTLTIPPR